MGVQWKLVFWLSIWIVCSAVKAQSSEDAAVDDNEEDYDDWTDRFDDIFKDLDDYEDTLKRINDAREHDQAIKESVSIDETLENLPAINNELQIEDDEARFSEAEKELKPNQYDFSDKESIEEDDIDLFKEDGSREDILAKDSDSSNQELDEEDELSVNALDHEFEDLNEADSREDVVAEDGDGVNDEVVGDENMNGNAPANDYDPLEVDKFESKESSQVKQPISSNKSPYSEQIDLNSEMFDDNISFEDIDDDKLTEALNKLDSISNNEQNIDDQLQNIYEETQDILSNDSGSDQFEDEVPTFDEHMETPQKIEDKTSDVQYSKKIGDHESFEAESIHLSKETKLSNEVEDQQGFNEDSEEPEDENSVENDQLDIDRLNALLEKQLDEMESISDENDDDYDIMQPLNDDSMERDRQELAEINALIEKQLSEMEEISEDDDDTREDYLDFYSDDIQEIKISKEEEIPAVQYENDAIDPNEVESEDKKDEILEKGAEPIDSIVEQKAKLVLSKENSKEQENQFSSKEMDDKINHFKSLYKVDIETDAALSDDPVIHIKLSLDDPIEITSPEYPSPYPGNNIVDWLFDGEEGTGIEFNITDLFINGDSGDYLLIKPGGVDISGKDGIIFTYELKHERKYRFFDVDKMFVRFESKAATNNFYRGFKFSVKFIDRKVERILEPEPIPEPVAQEPEDTLTLFLTGVPPHEFRNMSEQFRMILVDMTTMYVTRDNIDPGLLPLSDVVQLTRIAPCNINWPDHNSCSAVTFGVPLFYNETDGDYQLTTEQLLDMWLSYSNRDPFAVRLRLLGITEYNVPNDHAVISSWGIVSFAVLLVILGIGFALWRWNCFESYTGMTRLSETDSVYSENRKSDLSLYPTPHQNLPPMFEGEQYDNYLDEDLPPKYADTARVDMGGAFGKGFVRDGELFDLDSDEEIIMSLPDDGKAVTSNSSDIRPKDIYQV